VLVRCHLNRLSHIDVKTGEPARRYEHEYPGSLIHVDVKKLGNIPDGGGWRFVGRRQGNWNRQATLGLTRNKHRHEVLGSAFVHTVIDDRSPRLGSEASRPTPTAIGKVPPITRLSNNPREHYKLVTRVHSLGCESGVSATLGGANAGSPKVDLSWPISRTFFGEWMPKANSVGEDRN
jgi:hypothetical protein